MDILKTVPRGETDPRYRWDLTAIYKSDEDYQKDLAKAKEQSFAMKEKYRNQLKNKEIIEELLEDYIDIQIIVDRLSAYAGLPVEADATDKKAFEVFMNFIHESGIIEQNLSFIRPELLSGEESLLKEVGENPRYERFIQRLLRDKAITLSAKEEAILSKLSPTFGAFYDIYNTIKLQDIAFDDVEAGGESHPLTYNRFEGLYSSHTNTELRRKSFQAFYDKLEEYQESTARNYLAHCQMEKQLADLRGFDSVFDYLLHGQEVSRELYDRQIDIIMEKLAPIMQKYAKILQKEYKLDRMTTMDLLLAPDPDYSSEVSVEEAQKLVKEGLSVLGEEYGEILERAFNEQWVDYVNNTGKSTGAFCSFIHSVHPFVLINWTGLMTEAMVLAHELGHGGHAFLTAKEQHILDTRASMYFIEAPSTANELIMAHHLLENAKDEREKNWLRGQIIARTYFHNFVTHFLEAAFQREVYRLIDDNKSFTAEDLNEIFKKQLEKFWGPDIAIEGGVERTWMRQPHYYMGLYPYTYSAGLTIGTQVAHNILKEGQPAVERWLNTLRAGGRKDPVGLAQMAGVDITTEKPLLNTIEYIGSLVDSLA
ncbi:MAG: oligoendopeptidase F [Tissierellia bacterium]|nr:oligoendopeptidase F [Tissierellia bacterium]